MPPLTNTRHERFVLALLKGMSQTQAYIEAGYAGASARANSTTLMTKPDIKERLRELQEPIATKLQNTRELKLSKLEEMFLKEPIPDTISARDRVLAIAEHNRMEKVYETPEAQVVVENFIFILPDGTRLFPKQLMKGKEV